MKFNFFGCFIVIVLIFAACSQQEITYYDVKEVIQLIDKGSFSKAENIINNALVSSEVTDVDKWKFQFQKERMERIRMDFRLKREEVKEKLIKILGDISDEQIEKWTKSGSLEKYIIDGELFYFNRCVPNLFRINEEARKIRDEAIPPSAEFEVSDYKIALVKSIIDFYMNNTQLKINNQLKKGVLNDYDFVRKNYRAYNFHIKYKFTVKKNVTPIGYTITTWLPYPRENYRQSGVELLSTSQDNYIIAPNDYLQRTVFFQKSTTGNEPTQFEMEFKYTTHPFVTFINPDKVKEYDKSSELYNKFTSERPPHIVFTQELKGLATKIVGTEKNPFIKAKKIFKWVDDNRPWASAREYSTISNISMYCYESGHGDCGIQTLLFMTLARIAGIPTKWQSGWQVPPDGINLHDWSEMYIEPYGWLPVDVSYGQKNWSEEGIVEILKKIYGENFEAVLSNAGLTIDVLKEKIYWFYVGNIEPYRMVVNDDYSRTLYPAKKYPRSEPVDFQRGEVEYDAANLYFDKWNYHLKIINLDIE